MRALYIATCAAAVMIVTSVPSLILAAIWLESGKFAGTGALAFFVALGVVPAALMWSDNAPERRARLPRADRKHLRSEQRRIALEAAIRDAEREAGIQ